MLQNATKGETSVRHNSSAILTGLAIHPLSSGADVLLRFKNTLITSDSALLNKSVLHKATALYDTKPGIRNTDLTQTQCDFRSWTQYLFPFDFHPQCIIVGRADVPLAPLLPSSSKDT